MRTAPFLTFLIENDCLTRQAPDENSQKWACLSHSPPEWEQWPGQPDYMSALHVLDVGVGNLTAQLRESNMWDNTIFMLSADNGGDCGYQSGFASNYPLLGRKCQSYDGGTRTAAFVAGAEKTHPFWRSFLEDIDHLPGQARDKCNAGLNKRSVLSQAV